MAARRDGPSGRETRTLLPAGASRDEIVNAVLRDALTAHGVPVEEWPDDIKPQEIH